ncbi:MAG: glycosyltransferase family 2 protein, partial [Mycobacteriales bacterium]
MENGPRAAVSHGGDDTVQIPVSVIIPAYQRAGLVGRAVRSALEQRPAPAEVVVVDDCSTDGTAQAAEQAGARVVSLPHNQGQGGARNAGIEAAVQPWIALLDSDDEWLPGHLARVWAAREGYVLVSDSCLLSITRRYIGNAGRRPRVLRTPADLLWPSNPAPANCVLFPRADARAVGGFGARRLAEDLEFWLRLLERGPGLSLPGLGAFYHEHPGQISIGTRVDMHDAVRDALAGIGPRPWNT